jgi:hypothetical protein
VAVTRARTRRQREKAYRHANGLAWAIPDSEIERYVDELVAATMSREADAGAWFESISRYAREPHHDGLYDRAAVAACGQRLMMALFPSWPLQDPED